MSRARRDAAGGDAPPLRPGSARRSVPRALFAALRPHQWLKNALLGVAAVFSRRLLQPGVPARLALALLSYCALASAVYVWNDLRDRERDRLHPRKCRRPFAAGELSPGSGVALMALGLLTGLLAAVPLGSGFLAAAGVYLLVTLAYNAGLKAAAGLELLLVAAGYVVRVWAGALAVPVPASGWLLGVAAASALLLITGKRLAECATLGAARGAHRAVLGQYSQGFLRTLTVLTAGATLALYAAYTLRAPTAHLVLTLPAVAGGIGRYLQLALTNPAAVDPDGGLLSDPVLLTAGGLWLLASLWLLR